MSLLWKVPLGLLVLFALVVVFFVFGLRTKNRVALGTIRRIDKVVFNPRQMKSAGTPGAYASIVEHVGRSSGASYRTPICTREFGDELVVLLPYVRQADWVKNVFAAGSATIVREGTRIDVVDPRIVAIDDVVACISDADQRSNALFGNVDALRLRCASSNTTQTDTPDEETSR